LGPAPALHSKIKDQFRQQLLLSGPDEAALREWLLPALAEWEKEKEAKVQVLLDVDPLSID
jgi:primosomal protein N'